MANINFLYRSRSKKETGAVTLRLIHKSEIDLFINTGYISHRSYWFKSNGKQYLLPSGKTAEAKKEKEDLTRLESYIIEVFNRDYNEGIRIEKMWLQDKIDIFFKRKSENGNQTSPYIIDNVDRILKEAPYKPNQKGGIGLSKSRVDDYKKVKRFITEFQKIKSRHLKVSDIDLKFTNEFMSWFVEEKKYKISYGLRIISTIKSVCIDAGYNGVSINPQLGKVKSSTKNNEFVIYLTEEELDKIRKADLKRESLLNARKWLLLGCYIGQRGGDLLNITEKNITNRNGLDVIELTQEKTGKEITIPILPQAKAIITEGLPRPISQQRLNEYAKDICKIAEIDTPAEGVKKNEKTKRYEIGIYPKYELITTHSFRRSFASNFFGHIPTQLLMKITGHSSERIFYNYIGKSSYDFAQQMADFVIKLQQNETHKRK